MLCWISSCLTFDLSISEENDTFKVFSFSRLDSSSLIEKSIFDIFSFLVCQDKAFKSPFFLFSSPLRASYRSADLTCLLSLRSCLSISSFKSLTRLKFSLVFLILDSVSFFLSL